MGGTFSLHFSSNWDFSARSSFVTQPISLGGPVVESENIYMIFPLLVESLLETRASQVQFSGVTLFYLGLRSCRELSHGRPEVESRTYIFFGGGGDEIEAASCLGRGARSAPFSMLWSLFRSDDAYNSKTCYKKQIVHVRAAARLSKRF